MGRGRTHTARSQALHTIGLSFTFLGRSIFSKFQIYIETGRHERKPKSTAVSQQRIADLAGALSSRSYHEGYASAINLRRRPSAEPRPYPRGPPRCPRPAFGRTRRASVSPAWPLARQTWRTWRRDSLPFARLGAARSRRRAPAQKERDSVHIECVEVTWRGGGCTGPP